MKKHNIYFTKRSFFGSKLVGLVTYFYVSQASLFLSKLPNITSSNRVYCTDTTNLNRSFDSIFSINIE